VTDAEISERVVEPGPAYGDGEPVRILIRKRGRRYDIDDDGAAWAKAGALGRQALEAAEHVVAQDGFNVNRSGVVFVPAVEGRDIDALASRLADCSLAVYAELLELSG
jgi:hypothetical protein